ncbi:MAG: hypothetical protein KGR26_10465, partial [Cyanobacteria bacterium REEB65]|nr:hypothetical protein [Cyanobacteria bacterium REEB65]
ESLEAIFGATLNELHTALPARVEKYDSANQRADVKPVFLRVFLDEDGNERTYEYPILTDVPVHFPRGGGAFIHLPIAAGDLVLLVCAQRSLDRYLETDGKHVIDTQDARRHHISNAVAFAGLATSKNNVSLSNAKDLIIGLEDGSAEVHVQPGGKVFVKATSVMLGDSGLSGDNALVRNKEFQALVMAFNAHVHATGTGPSSSPTPIPNQIPVVAEASSSVYAK